MLTFLTESTRGFEETNSIGGFRNGSEQNSFDAIFTEAYNDMMAKGLDIMMDTREFIRNKSMINAYKDALLSRLSDECEGMMTQESANESTNYGTHSQQYNQISQMFDNCVEDMVKESTRVESLLPIKMIDFPILIKQNLKLVTNDIMQTEVVDSPIVKKHLEQTYIVDNNDTNKRWRYPQCFFTDEFKEAFAAGKGFPIKETPVPVADISNYDIIANLTDAAIPERESFTMDLKIAKVVVDADGEDVTIVLNPPMRINLSDGTWLGGKIKRTVTKSDGTAFEVDDLLMGMVDYRTKTTSIRSVTDQVKSVIFSGYLSNELNERGVGFEYVREEREWKIEDGTRASMSYSLEELEDAKALMDLDLYQKTYNNMGDYLANMEDSDVLGWLDEQYDLYNGIEIDPLGFDGFTVEDIFECDSTSITTALPNEYIEKMLKFKIDGIIIDMCDKAKLEDMTFVIYGNPRYIRFLNSSVNWVTRPGSTANGVKLDYSYGVMTSGDVKVQVVSTMKVNAIYDKEEKLHSGLRIIPFPLSKEQFTFKHYKYTTHILTAQNSAYRDANRPGGSKTYIMGVSRYKNAAVQGIQTKLKISNAEPYIKM